MVWPYTGPWSSRPRRGAEPPPVPSSQEVSTAAPETLGGDPGGDQNVEAAAAAARLHLGPARGRRCSTAPRWNRPELPPGSGERRQAGETGVPCRRRCTDALHLLRSLWLCLAELEKYISLAWCPASATNLVTGVL